MLVGFGAGELIANRGDGEERQGEIDPVGMGVDDPSGVGKEVRDRAKGGADQK